MIIIGERINSTRKSIKEAIDKKDIDFLLREAENQISRGAEFIDINCATTMENEEANLTELITAVQNKFKCGICIDSPDISVIISARRVVSKAPFINSITAEKVKIDKLPIIALDNESYAIALTIDEQGMPNDAETRISLARKIIDIAKNRGVERKYIYIDPLVRPVSTEPKQALYYLQALETLSKEGINTTGGLSNVSFGLPKRDLLNAVFLKLAIERGISAAIIDPTSDLIAKVLKGEEIPENIFRLAKNTLLGEDEYAMNYLKAFRKGELNF